MEKRLMNVKELCQYLAIPKATLYTYVSTGKVPSNCVKRIGRSLKFEKVEIDEWINGASTPGGPAR